MNLRQDFDSKVPYSGMSTSLLMFQLFGAPFLVMVLGFLVTVSLEKLGAGIIGSTIVEYLGYMLTGFLIGFRVQIAAPNAYFSGARWVWVAPTCLLALIVLQGLSKARQDIAGLFFETGHEDLRPLVFTLPAVASYFYSFGAYAAYRRREVASDPS
jgi:multisubunit Na+/H+ antiporter MnhE subunit